MSDEADIQKPEEGLEESKESAATEESGDSDAPVVAATSAASDESVQTNSSCPETSTEAELDEETAREPTEPLPPLEPIDANSWDYQNAEQVIELFNLAARANLEEAGRVGSMTVLPDHGRLLMTGDLHDNAPNLVKILKLAKLDESEDNHLILHELIHSKRLVAGCDVSIRMLARVAALKMQYLNQLHIMMGNHEWAQFMESGIIKAGKDVVEAFTQGVDFLFHDDAEAVTEAMKTFIRSMLLGVKCSNGIFCCHSLPSPNWMDDFDDSIMDRVPADEDFERLGPVYCITWGRRHDEFVAEECADAWGAKLFLMGHQPAHSGYDLEGYNMLILASDHDEGVALPIDLSKTYTIDDVIPEIVWLSSVE